MGTCYSTHSRPISVSTADMPHDTSLTADVTEKSALRPVSATQSHMFGFRKPYGGRYGKVTNSNEQSSRGGTNADRSPLGMVTDTSDKGSNTALNKQKADNIDSPPRRFGFGFKPQNKKVADANKNPQKTISSESLNSNSSLSRKGSQNSQRRPGAYNPKDKHSSLESWRMIDDSSTAESMSSAGDKISSRLENIKAMNEEDAKNANISPEDTPVSHKSSSSTSTLTDKKSTNGFKAPSGPKLQSRFRGPLAKFYASKSMDKPDKADNWVKASSAQTTAATAKGKPPPHSQPKKSGGVVPNFLKRGLLRKQKSASVDGPADSSLSGKDKKGQDKDTKSQGVSTANGQPRVEVEEDPVFAEVGQNNAQFPSRHKAGAQKLFDIPFGKAPIAMIDSIETTSIGSIGSDDLMLETDIPLEDYEELGPSEPGSRHQSTSESSARPPYGSKPRSRSRSQSRDSLDGDKVIKPALVQRSTSDNRGLSTGDSFKKKTNKSVSLDIEQDNEPLQELASLLEHNNCVSRRNPRHQRANRPASFPGWRASMEGDGPPSLGGSIGGTPTTPTDSMKVFRPPKEPSFDDPDPVIVDSFTYRHLQQDMTNMKTMALKLKRLLQEDELGTPIGSQPLNQSWGSKNGFKQLGGSQPGSPFHGEDKRFSFSDKEATEPASMDGLKQENVELRYQLQMLQHQVEEQDRTIRLLQQQMTKYECGHVGPGGKSYTHSASQTDKPRLPISKSVFESSGSRRLEASEARPVVRYRTELSSSTRMGSEEIEETEGVCSVPSESESGIEGDPKDNILDDFASDELGVHPLDIHPLDIHPLDIHPLDEVDDVLERECDRALQEDLVTALNTNSNSGHYIEVLDVRDGQIIEEHGLSDSTDRDIETLAQDVTQALAQDVTQALTRSPDTPGDHLGKIDCSEMSDDPVGTSDTVTSVTDDLISSLTTPSSESAMEFVVPHSGLPDSSVGNEIAAEHWPDDLDLADFPGEGSPLHHAESTPLSVKGKGGSCGMGVLNVTFDAAGTGVGSMHDFNVQTEERLEHCVPKSIECELEQAEREEEELSMSGSEGRKTSQNHSTRVTLGEIVDTEVLQKTFTVDSMDVKDQTFILSEALPKDGCKKGPNSTFTIPASPGQPKEVAAISKSMVRSETHSSGYQSDVMATSTTSSDVMATSLTSAEPEGPSSTSGNPAVQSGCPSNGVEPSLASSCNGTLPSIDKPKSKLTKPKLSGLQRPKFQSQVTKNNNAINEKENTLNQPPKEKSTAGTAAGNKNIRRPTSLAKKYTSSNSGVLAYSAKTKTASPSPLDPPEETKSKMAVPKAGKLARYGGGPAKSSKLPAYGSKQNAGKPSQLKPPTSLKSKSKST